MFRVNNKDTRTTSLTSYFTQCSDVSTVDFEQVNAGWVCIQIKWNNISQLTFSCSQKTIETLEKSVKHVQI